MKPRRLTGLALVEVPPRVEASLWRRLRFEAEPGCREKIFMRYRGLARALAKRKRGRAIQGTEAEDAEHFAYEGLLQAIDRFDPLRGIPFGAFARRRIAGSIADGVARQSEVAAQSRQRGKVQRERLELLGRTAAEESDGLSALSSLVSGLAIGLLLEDSGLVAPDGGADTRPSAYDALAMRELAAVLRGEVARLPHREAMIIRLHYEDGVSFTHIAELLDLSKGRVSQLHGAALLKLKRRIRNST
ncbi:sigma-70 family RNA polymerase sigma factor [Sphingomonas sp. BT-65]|uniref:sigma-70 family RNA polymerase sigma factor n=1 Tax=Sphingomonas sp. BT-65 TaxID=2989821 RepID=UPI002235AA5F|nr:sigma-70 family RNA polymerase sigma factor [Sphingomonas sp. BT-65]MCW4463806.1 sigma-70 family RNA polymerase sigma factor [Sphingomonas sp. BT-65]